MRPYLLTDQFNVRLLRNHRLPVRLCAQCVQGAVRHPVEHRPVRWCDGLCVELRHGPLRQPVRERLHDEGQLQRKFRHMHVGLIEPRLCGCVPDLHFCRILRRPDDLQVQHDHWLHSQVRVCLQRRCLVRPRWLSVRRFERPLLRGVRHNGHPRHVPSVTCMPLDLRNELLKLLQHAEQHFQLLCVVWVLLEHNDRHVLRELHWQVVLHDVCSEPELLVA